MKFERKVENFLRGTHFAKLATLNRDGSIQLTPVWYMYDRNGIIVNTTPDRLKFRNIMRDPRVALLIDEGYNYVSIRGTARVAKERDAKADIKALAIRYEGEEKGRRDSRERYWKQERVSIEIQPERVLSGL